MDGGSGSLVEDWWEYHRLAGGSRDERKALEAGLPVRVGAAHDLVAEKIATGSPDVLEILALLIDGVPEGQDVATVGAGPLEDLLHEHGDRLIADIETSARRSPAFANAMSSVWLEVDGLEPATVARLAPWVATSPSA